jgi:hypothetical protein
MVDRPSGRCPFCATPLQPGAERCPQCGVDLNKASGLDLEVRPSDPGGSSGLELDEARPVARRRPSSPPDAPSIVYEPDAGAGGRGLPEQSPARRGRSGSSGGAWRAIAAVAAVLAVAAGAYLYFFRPSLPLGPSEPPPEVVGIGDVVAGELTPERSSRTYQLFLLETTVVTIAVDGSFDSMVELYGGDLQRPIASDDDSGSGSSPLLTRRLRPGTYHVVVRSFEEERGTYRLSIRRAAR